VFKYSNLVKVLAQNIEPEPLAGLCDSCRPAVVICCGDIWRVSGESCVHVVDGHCLLFSAPPVCSSCSRCRGNLPLFLYAV